MDLTKKDETIDTINLSYDLVKMFEKNIRKTLKLYDINSFKIKLLRLFKINVPYVETNIIINEIDLNVKYASYLIIGWLYIKLSKKYSFDDFFVFNPITYKKYLENYNNKIPYLRFNDKDSKKILNSYGYNNNSEPLYYCSKNFNMHFIITSISKNTSDNKITLKVKIYYLKNTIPKLYYCNNEDFTFFKRLISN